MEIIGFITLIIIITLFSGIFTVDQQEVKIIERFGKFLRIASPGLNIKIPFIDQIAGKLNLRLTNLNVEVETKTLDNVFIKILVSIQFKVLPNKIYEAFYTLNSPKQQIESFVFDVVRAKVPHIVLDDVFSKKDEIANSVTEELLDLMNTFGFYIQKALVTDVDPDPKVKAAMNEINEAQRLRVASIERGEAEKIMKVKQAEADAQSQILHGQGIAGQRRAIIDGLKDSFEEFQKHTNNTNSQEIMNIILISQYFDTLKEIGHHSKSNTVFLSHSPNNFGELFNQIKQTIISGQNIDLKK